MGVAGGGSPDSRISVWDTDPEEAPAGTPSPQPMTTWQRLAVALGQLRPARPPTPASAHRPARHSGVPTSLPSSGRGQALREAHRVLRRELRRHPALPKILPHLAYIEQWLARRGTAALFEMPLSVMQRGLQQLARVPWEDRPEASSLPLQTLRLRLIEAIESRHLHVAVQHQAAEDEDSGHGSPDSPTSLGASPSLPPTGIVDDDLPSRGFDDLDHDPLPRAAASPGGPGWRRR